MPAVPRPRGDADVKQEFGRPAELVWERELRSRLRMRLLSPDRPPRCRWSGRGIRIAMLDGATLGTVR